MDDNRKIVQHNAITQARFDMSALEMNIFFMLLAQIRDGDPVSKMYQISAKELFELSGRESNIKELQEATKRLLERVFETPTPKGYLQVSIIASAEYLVGKGIIELEISQKVRPYLFELKNNFTTYQLQMALMVHSKYSKRLYQILSQFKDTGNYYVTVEDLKKMLKLIDEKKGEEQYEKYSAFKEYVLHTAQRELESYTDISFTYEEKKQGRKIHLLHFLIIHNALAATKIEISPEKQELLKKLVDKFSLADWQARKIIENVDAKQIHKITYDINLKVLNKEVTNVGAYTAMEFEKKYNLGIFKFDK